MLTPGGYGVPLPTIWTSYGTATSRGGA